MGFIDIHVHQDNTEVLKDLDKITKKLNTMANSIADLTAKIDAMQVANDAKQAEIIQKVDVIQEELAGWIASGGTEQERQALADKIQALHDDIVSTDINAPESETPQG